MASLIMTDKLLDVLSLAVREDTRLLALEGPARSAKTVVAIQAFYYRVFDSDIKYHAICGRDLDAIRKNILKTDSVGLMTTHRDIKLVKDNIGGYFLKFKSPKGVKEIYLVNYSDSSSWKKILGGTFGVLLIDEVNIADKIFLQETFSRQLSATTPFTIMTTNGDNPDHFIYQNYYNFCKIVGDAPASTRGLVNIFQKNNGVKSGYYYCHFKMSDNPVMTEEKLKIAMSLYPVGSYYYTTKILGERGVQGSLIFEDYMKKELVVNAFECDANGTRKYEFDRYTIAMDIGEDRAHNVICLTGFTRFFKQAIVLKMESFLKVGYNTKKERLYSFISYCLNTLKIEPCRIKGVIIDSAEQNFIADLNSEVRRLFRLDVIGSYKSTILDRINMMIVGFSSSRILFHSDCVLAYDSYHNALWVEGEEGKTRQDNNEEKNDVMDTVEYSMTRFMADFLAAGGLH